MKTIDVSAATVEEAINDGLAKLGCSISDCKVQILQEGAKGLFGLFGSKPAKVRLTLVSDEEEKEDDFSINLREAMDASSETRPAPEKRQAPRPARPAPQPKKAEPAAEKPAVKPVEKAEKTEEKPAEKPVEKTNDVLERFKNAPLPGGASETELLKSEQTYVFRPAKQQQRPPRREPRPARRERDENAAPAEPIVRKAEPAPENIVIHPADTLEGQTQQFLLELTKRMGLDVQVDVHLDEEGHVFANIYGDALGILIGRRGETLDALQYLTSLQVNKGREGYTRVTLDTEHYRAKREEALTRLASRMANRAVKTGRKVALEPMNPYERRILHASLQANPNVTTHSEGDEPYRHVVIVPNK